MYSRNAAVELRDESLTSPVPAPQAKKVITFVDKCRLGAITYRKSSLATAVKHAALRPFVQKKVETVDKVRMNGQSIFACMFLEHEEEGKKLPFPSLRSAVYNSFMSAYTHQEDVECLLIDELIEKSPEARSFTAEFVSEDCDLLVSH